MNALNAIAAIYLLYFFLIVFFALVVFSIADLKVNTDNQRFAKGLADPGEMLFQRFAAMGAFFYWMRFAIFADAVITTIVEAGIYWNRVGSPRLLLGSIWVSSIVVVIAITSFLDAISACRHCLQRRYGVGGDGADIPSEESHPVEKEKPSE